jgi:putative sterol carrier protein
MVIDDVSYGRQTTVDSPKQKELNIEDIISSLPNRFKKEKANGIEMTILFEFENDLYYQIEIKNQNIVLSTVDSRQSTVDLTITTTTETYIAVETGKLNPQEAFMSGKIQVSDLGKMMQFGSLFKKYN